MPLRAGGAGAVVRSEETLPELVASIRLSLDRLDTAALEVLPRLGVFQGGAFEDGLLEITGLGDPASAEREQVQALLQAIDRNDARALAKAVGLELPDGIPIPPDLMNQLKSAAREEEQQLREMLASMPAPAPGADAWPAIRRQLEAAALIEAETLPGVSVPFLRFHPTLAPMLRGMLSPEERTRLETAHRKRYYALAGYLYQADDRTPDQARTIFRREMPNLLHAVHAALDAEDPDAGTFVTAVNRFLGVFGLKRELETLVARAQTAGGEVGSHTWYLAKSNQGEQLFAAGQVAEAAEVFQKVLEVLGEAPSYERAVTFTRLGRCFGAGGRPDLATQQQEEALAVLERIEQTPAVKRHRGACLTELGDALRYQGRYAEARKAYEAGLELMKDIGDQRSQGAILGQLGTLAMQEGNLNEAKERYQEALTLFQRLGEPAMEAVAWHQLGLVFQEAQQWEEAERHYREAARNREEQGDLAAAAQTWNQLAIVTENAGKPEAAEGWYRKAIEGGRRQGDMLPLARALNNLADLLQTLPGRLAEARTLAEEALEIKKTLDPGAAQIWTTYTILAEIAEKEAEAAAAGSVLRGERHKAARNYRRLAREAKRGFAGTGHELKQMAPLIEAVVVACGGNGQARVAVSMFQEMLRQQGGEAGRLAAAIDRVLAGERDAETLCEGLGPGSSMILEAILDGLSSAS